MLALPRRMRLFPAPLLTAVALSACAHLPAGTEAPVLLTYAIPAVVDGSVYANDLGTAAGKLERSGDCMILRSPSGGVGTLIWPSGTSLRHDDARFGVDVPGAPLAFYEGDAITIGGSSSNTRPPSIAAAVLSCPAPFLLVSTAR